MHYDDGIQQVLYLVWFCNKLGGHCCQLLIFVMESLVLFFSLQLTQPSCNHLVLNARWFLPFKVIAAWPLTFVIKPLRICSKFKNFDCGSFTTVSTWFVSKLDDLAVHLQLLFFVFIKKVVGASSRGWHSHCFVEAFAAIDGFWCFGAGGLCTRVFVNLWNNAVHNQFEF